SPRLEGLQPERGLEPPASRESFFLVTTLLLVGLALVIFWGPFFPLISEFFTGDRHSLAAPWFDRYVTPIGVLLVLFTGIGPLFAWGRLSSGAAKRLLLWPSIATAVTIAVLLTVSDAGHHVWALLIFAFAAFALVALWGEFWRAGATRHALTGEAYPRALANAVGRNRRRYGGLHVPPRIPL